MEMANSSLSFVPENGAGWLHTCPAQKHYGYLSTASSHVCHCQMAQVPSFPLCGQKSLDRATERENRVGLGI